MDIRTEGNAPYTDEAKFAGHVKTLGISHIYGIEKRGDETEEQFKARIEDARHAD